MDRIFQIQRFDKRARSSAYVSISLPSQGWLERPWPRRSWAIRGNPREPRKSICASQASALSGQPWLKTIGCPASPVLVVNLRSVLRGDCRHDHSPGWVVGCTFRPGSLPRPSRGHLRSLSVSGVTLRGDPSPFNGRRPSRTASANAFGASCGRLWPMPPVMSPMRILAREFAGVGAGSGCGAPFASPSIVMVGTAMTGPRRAASPGPSYCDSPSASPSRHR